MDVAMVRRSPSKTKNIFIDKIKTVIYEGVQIKVRLNEYWYDKIFNQKFLDDKNKKFITADEANDFVKNHIVGKITKAKLDAQRNQEINSADMMM